MYQQNIFQAGQIMDNKKNKISDSQEQRGRDFSLSNSLVDFSHFVSVYLRKANKRSYKVCLPTPCQLDQLFDEIQDTLMMNKKNVTVYYQGNKYKYLDIDKKKEDQRPTLLLKSKEIIHVHDQKQIKENITIYLQIYSQKNKLVKKQFGFESKQKIKTFISAIKCCFHELKDINVALIESGRKLSDNLSFSDQDIEDLSTISIFLEKPIQKLTEFIDKDIQKEKYHSYPPFQLSEFEKQHYQNQTPNFKKKLGRGIYKSAKNSSCDLPIWESDSSEEVNRKQLMKMLLKKKNNKQQQIATTQMTDSFSKKKQSQNEKFSPKERLSLKLQIKKLFQSDVLHHSQTEVKKLQPPRIATDDFIEQIQEVEFNDGENESNKKNLSSQLKLPIGIDLTQSLGKHKKKIPNLIPTRDFDQDIFNDDDMEI